jgi:hypothetical protein
MELAFSHTLSPSAMDLPDQIIAKIRMLPRIEQQRLFSSLST